MSDDVMQVPTKELIVWLNKKYSRHGEIEDGLAAERLHTLTTERERLRAALEKINAYIEHRYQSKQMKLARDEIKVITSKALNPDD
jgi:hypothetical protein